MFTKKSGRPQLKTILLAVGLVLIAFSLLMYQTAAAQDDGSETAVPPVPPSPIHPTYPLLDAHGENVLNSGNPVSTMNTCGGCHDATFIVEHSFHADVGLREMAPPGETDSGRPWDTSPGIFGKWNPLTYRYLSPAGDERVDLTTPAWVMRFGSRHVGGGPAVYSQDGTPLVELPPDADSYETSIVDPETGELTPWDWQESGVVEMNCFLCHTPKPNNDARVAALESGEFKWANTASLLGTEVVTQTEDGRYEWNPEAFNEAGELDPAFLNVQGATNQNCSQCHGLVHVDAQTPLALDGCSPEQWSTITTGQIVSPQRLSNSGMNLPDKNDLSRSWDIHAERVIGCTDCHYALNNPVYYQEPAGDRPDHLVFDPRRINLGEYLYRPLHQFAKGQSAQSSLAAEFDNSLRRCESCHSINATHEWLPYKEKHMSALSCETCHIPQMYAPARMAMDWTVLRADGTPQADCRGVEGEGETFSSVLVDGFTPVLLGRENRDGNTTLAPHNLISAWFWVYGDPARPVPYPDLQAALLTEDGHHPEVLAAFDSDGDGVLTNEELVIDSEAKETAVIARLSALGLENPRIQGEIQPYSVNHDVTHGEWATKDCRSCHGDESRVTQPMQLASHIPGGVMPTFVSGTQTTLSGDLHVTEEGALFYQPQTEDDDLYILGHNSVGWIDWAGALIFLGTIAGVTVHGGLRFFAARRYNPKEPALQKTYMYGVYERLWHWLQTAAIMLLIFTGLIIHQPDQFGIFSFTYVVQVHNVLAAILVINAALSLFYHLVSGEIQQFLPRPYGFFDQAIDQAKYYLRGIFRGEEHPFEKTRQRKMNPLQQVTYFGILNVLLPLQIITGALMWGAQRWPEIAAQLGGLPFLAPFHTLIAWLFAAFIVMHVYLTTTAGHTPLAGIKSMIMGWDEVEIHTQSQEEVAHT